MSQLRVAIVGLGKIARDQHVPSIAATAGVEFVAVASPHSRMDGVAHYGSLDDLLAKDPGSFDAVALCTPPQVRHEQAVKALAARKHVLLEKPPGATLSEIRPLETMAQNAGVTLFATWHSRFAAAVEPARDFLSKARIDRVEIEWKESVRKWHPGQAWIWEPGGLGVFDPGINALSIVTHILPTPIFLTKSELSFPENRAAPIAADLAFRSTEGLAVKAAFDWREAGGETWTIRVSTDQGLLVLSEGGKKLHLDGRSMVDAENAEYRGIYERFAQLVSARESDVDLAPLQHVADAFLLGRRLVVEAFIEG